MASATTTSFASLRFSSKLAAAAREHSAEMAQRGYFSHDSANGTSFDKRISRYYSISGKHYWSVGENLLWSSPDVDAVGALNMWLNSPEHRKILLTARWREIGLSAVHVASASGTYGGREVTIVTADFGVRRQRPRQIRRRFRVAIMICRGSLLLSRVGDTLFPRRL